MEIQMIKKLFKHVLFGKNTDVSSLIQEDPELVPKSSHQQVDLNNSNFFSKHKSVEIISQLDELKSLIKAMPLAMQQIPLTSIKLNISCSNILRYEKVETLAELLVLSNSDISNWKGFTRKFIINLIVSVKSIARLDLHGHQSYINIAEKLNWVYHYLIIYPDQKEIFEEQVIINDDTYLQHCNTFETEVIYKAENFRYDFFFDYIDNENPIELLKICPSWLLEMDVTYFECDTRLSNIIIANDIKFINDFKRYKIIELSTLPNMGRKSLIALAEFINKAKLKGQPPSLENMKFSYKNLGVAFFSSFDKITIKSHKYIFEHRLGLFGPTKTFKEISLEVGLSPPRVQQIYNIILKKIIDEELWDDYFNINVLLVTENSSNPVYLDKFSEINPWLSGFEGDDQLLMRVILCFSHLKPKFLKKDNRTILCNVNNDEWKKIKFELTQSIEHTLDLQYTIADIKIIIETKLTDVRCRELSSLMFDELFPIFNFTVTDSELVLFCIGNSLTNQLKILLNDEIVPIHYLKIKDLFETQYGIKILAQKIYSNLNSGDFLLFNRGIFGIEKHFLFSNTDQQIVMHQAENFLHEQMNKQCNSFEILDSLQSLESIELIKLDEYTLNIILKKSKNIKSLTNNMWIYCNLVD